MIRNFIIKYIAGNLDNLIAVLQGLDKELDSYIDAQTKKDAQLEDEKLRIENDQREVRAATSTALNLKGGLQGLTQNAGGIPTDNTVRIQ